MPTKGSLAAVFGIALSCALITAADAQSSREIVRVVVSDAASESIAPSENLRSLTTALPSLAGDRGLKITHSESLRHDTAGGTLSVPGYVFCGKTLRPLAGEDRDGAARLDFMVEDGGSRVVWTSLPREGADATRLKHREFELVFVPADLFPALAEAGRCWG